MSGGAAALAAVARWLRPDLTSPSAPMTTAAWLDSFSPSLMPRTSTLQGIVGGVSVLASREIANRSEQALAPLLGPRGALPRRIAVRAGVGLLGTALTRLPEREAERLWWSGLRGGGTMLQSLAAGGAIHDVGWTAWTQVDRRGPDPVQQAHDRGLVRATVATASVAAGMALWADRRLHHRESIIDPWPIEQRTEVPASAAVSAGVVLVGRLLGMAIRGSGRGITAWLGRGHGKPLLAHVANTWLWVLLARAGYRLGVTRTGTSNARVEAPYATPPSRPEVSGSPGSHSPFAELGRQGRRMVSEVLTPEEISEVMGEPAVAQPIRIYVGMDSEPLYPTQRAEIALAELERTGAYERSHLLLVSPTGTGWIEPTAVDSAEMLTRGDIATVAIQYARYPSFLAAQNVALGRSQFRILLLGVRERLRAMPPERRPRVLVFGLSMGAWTASDVVMHTGIGGFDHYGIDRALWVGMPWLAKWSSSGMSRGSSALVPPGTVGFFDRHEDLAALSAPARERLRAVVLSHDNDPVALLGPDLAVHRPAWLGEGPRGRGVPDSMRWTPVVTFLQTMVDALNSMVQVPGHFTSHGHDYRADMARFVGSALHLPAADEAQVRAVEQALVARDLDRASRLGTLEGPAVLTRRPPGELPLPTVPSSGG